tara:strand:+ start:197 stop:442 length:246 start_codon:yes stop_codon:yes gene_type:complete
METRGKTLGHFPNLRLLQKAQRLNIALAQIEVLVQGLTRVVENLVLQDHIAQAQEVPPLQDHIQGHQAQEALEDNVNLKTQ